MFWFPSRFRYTTLSTSSHNPEQTRSASCGRARSLDSDTCIAWPLTSRCHRVTCRTVPWSLTKNHLVGVSVYIFCFLIVPAFTFINSFIIVPWIWLKNLIGKSLNVKEMLWICPPQKKTKKNPTWSLCLSLTELGRKEGNVLFNDALNTFYLRLYGIRHMVKDHSDSTKVAHVAAAGFLSRYLNGPLPYVCHHITINKMCWMCC